MIKKSFFCVEMAATSSLTLNGTTYTSTANPLPYMAGAVVVNTALKHLAPHPWRNIPSAIVWGLFAGLAFLPFRRALNEDGAGDK
jgi:hypothetical protein